MNRLAEYNPDHYRDSLKGNGKIGDAAENYLGQLLELERTKKGHYFPDLQSSFSWKDLIYVESKSSNNKALVYVAQMFADDIIAEMLKKGRILRPNRKNPQLELMFWNTSEVRTYYGLINKLNGKGINPTNKHQTTAFQWGDIYIIPTEVARALYIEDVLRKRGDEEIKRGFKSRSLQGETQEERLENLLEGIELIRKGLIDGLSGHKIIVNLRRMYREGKLGVDPMVFGSKRKREDDNGIIVSFSPHRFENLAYSKLRALFDNDPNVWERVNFTCPSSHGDFYYSTTNSPSEHKIYFMDKDSRIIKEMKKKIKNNSRRLKQIAWIRSILGKSMVYQLKNQFLSDMHKKLKDKLEKTEMYPRIWKGITQWNLTRSESEQIQETIKRTLTKEEIRIINLI